MSTWAPERDCLVETDHERFCSSFDEFAFHLHTNTIGPIITAQRLLQTMIPIGTIVFMSSDSGSAQRFLEMEDGYVPLTCTLHSYSPPLQVRSLLCIKSRVESGDAAYGCRTQAQRRRYYPTSNSSWRGRHVSTVVEGPEYTLTGYQGYGKHRSWMGSRRHHDARRISLCYDQGHREQGYTAQRNILDLGE